MRRDLPFSIVVVDDVRVGSSHCPVHTPLAIIRISLAFKPRHIVRINFGRIRLATATGPAMTCGDTDLPPLAQPNHSKNPQHITNLDLIASRDPAYPPLLLPLVPCPILIGDSTEFYPSSLRAC